MNQGIPIFLFLFFLALLWKISFSASFVFKRAKSKAIKTKKIMRIILKIVANCKTGSLIIFAEAITCPIDCKLPPIKALVSEVEC